MCLEALGTRYPENMTYRRGRRVRGTDDGNAEGRVDRVGEAQAGADGGAVFYGA